MARDIRSTIRSTILPPAYTMRGNAPTLSVLLIGTAETGPVNEIVVPRSMQEATQVFGSLGRGNLLQAYHEFILGSSRGTDLRTMVGLMRVDSGEAASISLPEGSSGEGASAPEEPSVTAFTITSLYKDAISNDIQVGYRYTDYGNSVVVVLPASIDPSGESTEYMFPVDLTGVDTTKINSLVDLQDAINAHPIVGRYIRAEVNTINRQYSLFAVFGGDDAPATFDTWKEGNSADDAGASISLVTRFTSEDDVDSPGDDSLGDFTPIDLFGNDNSGQLSATLLRSVDDIVTFNNVLASTYLLHKMDAGTTNEDPSTPLYAMNKENFRVYPIVSLHDYDKDNVLWSKPNYKRLWNDTEHKQYRLPGYFPTSEAYFDIDTVLNPDGSSTGNMVEGLLPIPPDPFAASVLTKDIFRWKIDDAVSKIGLDESFSIHDTGQSPGSTVTKDCYTIDVLDANMNKGTAFVFQMPDAVYNGGDGDTPIVPGSLTDDITKDFYNNDDGYYELANGHWYVYKIKNNGNNLNVAFILKQKGNVGTGGSGTSLKIWVPGESSVWDDDTSYDFVSGTGTCSINNVGEYGDYLYLAFKFDYNESDGAAPQVLTSVVSTTESADSDLHSYFLAALANVDTYNVLLMDGDKEIRFYYGNAGMLQGYGALSPNIDDNIFGIDFFDWVLNGGVVNGLGVASTRTEFANLDNYNDHTFEIRYTLTGRDWYEVPLTWTDSIGTERRSFLAKWIYKGEDIENADGNTFNIYFIPDTDLVEGDVDRINTTFPFLEASWDGSSVNVNVKQGYKFRLISDSAKFLLKYVVNRELLDKWNEYTIYENELYFASAFSYKLNYNLFTSKKLVEGVHFSYSKSDGTILITDTDLIPDSGFKTLLLQFDYDYEPEWFSIGAVYTTLSGGSDGIDEMTPLKYKKCISESLDTLKTHAVFDIIVPKGAYIDETDFVYDPTTGTRVEKNVGFFDLFNDFTNTVSTECPMSFILSTKPFRAMGRVGYTNSEIDDWYKRMTDTSDIRPNAVATMVNSTTNMSLTVLCQPYRMPAPGGLTYITDAAAYVAGLAARLDYSSNAALTSTLVNAALPNGVTPAFRVPYDYEDGLLSMRYLVSNIRDDGVYRIVRDYTLDNVRGALRHLTHVFVAQSIKHELITTLKTFIGQTLVPEVKIAIASSIQNVLQRWTTNGVIEQAPFTIHWDRVDANIGIIPVTLIITRSPIIQGARLDIVVR